MSAGLDADLIKKFWDQMPERLGEAGDLWLKVEEGDASSAVPLKRVLHTLKGEAHMLGAKTCGDLLGLTEKLVAHVAQAENPRAVGDMMLSVFDALALMAAGADEAALGLPALTEELQGILAAEAAVTPSAQPGPSGLLPSEQPRQPSIAVGVSGASTPSPAGGSETKPDPESPSPGDLRGGNNLDAGALQAMIYEAHRLHRENSSLQPEFREIRRMFRALLAEIDPNTPQQNLAERIVKTLSYGAEIERRMADLMAQWSATEFSLKTALEHLEDAVRAAAMVSVGSLSSQIHRTARTAARSVRKQVDVRVSGDAYVDATVERHLGPALLHLVRNAVDHGIEDAETRAKLGKPEKGRIEVSVVQTESTVTVTVSDDGSGVDLERLRHRVTERDPSAANLDDASLLQRIFDPEVSTRDEVTELSGRGIGLNVVALQARAIGGTVRVHSTPGAGTRFEIAAPTMIRADLVVPIRVAGSHLALPARAVVGVQRLEETIPSADGPRLAVGAGENRRIIPLCDIGGLFGLDREINPGDAIVLVQHAAGQYGLRVDGYDNPRAMSFERIEELAFSSELVRGVSPTPHGGVFYMLNPDVLFSRLRGGAPALGASGAAAQSKRRVPHVLVVEDAPVARELLLGILKSFGIRVSDAADGRQGLAQARKHRPDLILTDVEMPFLGGLEMLAELRKDPELADVPVIVLTTLDEAHVRARASALRVNAFLSKQKFVESDLRRVIDEYLRLP